MEAVVSRGEVVELGGDAHEAAVARAHLSYEVREELNRACDIVACRRGEVAGEGALGQTRSLPVDRGSC